MIFYPISFGIPCLSDANTYPVFCSSLRLGSLWNVSEKRLRRGSELASISLQMGRLIMCLQSGPGPVRSVHPQELVQWRTTTSLGKKYNEFFIDPVHDSKVKQWYKLTTRCILGMSSKNIRSDLSTTFAKTWRARNKPPFLFSPVALLGRFCGPSMACPFLQRDSMAAQATQGH